MAELRGASEPGEARSHRARRSGTAAEEPPPAAPGPRSHRAGDGHGWSGRADGIEAAGPDPGRTPRLLRAPFSIFPTAPFTTAEIGLYRLHPSHIGSGRTVSCARGFSRPLRDRVRTAHGPHALERVAGRRSTKRSAPGRGT